MGNLRSAEKALERSGARPHITNDHDAIRASDGAVLPGVGAFPKAMRNIRELELDGLIGELLAGGMPMLGICLGMQLLFETTTENEGGWGLRTAVGKGRATARAGAEGPAHRLERREVGAAHGAGRGPARRVPVLLRALLRAGRRSREDVLGTSSYGEPFVCAVERAPCLRRAVPPREVERARPSAAAQLHVDLRCRRRRLLVPDPLSRDRHPRGEGGPSRAGRLRAPQGLRLRSARRRPAVGGRGRDVAARGGPRRRPRGAAREPRAPGADRCARRRARAVRRRAADGRRCLEAVAAGADRVVDRHRRVHRSATSWTP